MQEALSEEVRRFLLTSVPTVPHLEMLLLLWREPTQAWSNETIAARLYISRQSAARIAEDLCKAEFLVCEGDPKIFRCRCSTSLDALLAAVDTAYSRRLREVTLLIHSSPSCAAVRSDAD